MKIKRSYLVRIPPAPYNSRINNLAHKVEDSARISKLSYLATALCESLK